MGMDDCAVGSGVLCSHCVVFRFFGRAYLGAALHGVAGDDDRHVAAELGPGHADAAARQGADDHSGRAIISIWTAMGISMFALLLPLGMSGRADQQVCVAVVVTLLGTANAASGIPAEVEGANCVRGGVVAGGDGFTVWHRNAKLDRVSGGDFLLPDCVRNLRDDSGVA